MRMPFMARAARCSPGSCRRVTPRPERRSIRCDVLSSGRHLGLRQAAFSLYNSRFLPCGCLPSSADRHATRYWEVVQR